MPSKTLQVWLSSAKDLKNRGYWRIIIDVSSSASFCEEGSFSESLRRNLYKAIG